MTAPCALTVRVCLELLHICGQQNHFEQVFDAAALNFAEILQTMVSPPHSSGTRLVLGELLEHAIRICALLIDLIDSDDDRHILLPWRG